MGTTTTQRLHSICADCQEPIHITIDPGQRWNEVEWTHVDAADSHPPVPEMRFAIDATCPNCGHPEIGYAPAREEFVCSRCLHTQTERPKD